MDREVALEALGAEIKASTHEWVVILLFNDRNINIAQAYALALVDMRKK